MQNTPKAAILRIELWHGLMLLGLIAVLSPLQIIEIRALIAGGLFMAVNFLLLCFGVASVLTPLGGRKRVKTGVALLVVKVVIFLALLTTLFFKFSMDALSFSVGFSTLLLAIVVESVRMQFYSRA